MKLRITKKLIHKAILIVATLGLGTYLGLLQIRPPALDEKSQLYPAYERMMGNIQKMAVSPHPSGSTEIGAVRAHIVSEIREMGLELSIQSFVATWRDETLPMQNILVKLASSETERGVMFVSHYDSTARGPGAADAMLPVCAMLEAMRAYSQNNSLKNNIYFLFTDGEELGLFGAKAFAEAHPELAEKIDMAINLEARGNRGALLLFETSPKAYPLLKYAKKSGAKPVGFSWASSIYEKMGSGH
jgi:putative aminopeptidase FrvX